MPGQAQLSIGDTAAAPLSYEVPNAQVIGLVCANATFDGSGAGGSWLPALELVSDAGHVVARAIPTTPVVAGGSAEVTFGPFLGPPVGAGGTPYDPGVPADGTLFNWDMVPPTNFGAWKPTGLDFSFLPPPDPGYEWVIPAFQELLPF